MADSFRPLRSRPIDDDRRDAGAEIAAFLRLSRLTVRDVGTGTVARQSRGQARGDRPSSSFGEMLAVAGWRGRGIEVRGTFTHGDAHGLTLRRSFDAVVPACGPDAHTDWRASPVRCSLSAPRGFDYPSPAGARRAGNFAAVCPLNPSSSLRVFRGAWRACCGRSLRDRGEHGSSSCRSRCTSSSTRRDAASGDDGAPADAVVRLTVTVGRRARPSHRCDGFTGGIWTRALKARG